MTWYDTFNSGFFLSLASLLLVCMLSSLKLCYQMKINEYNFCGLKVTRNIQLEIDEERQMIEKIPRSRRNSLLPV